MKIIAVRGPGNAGKTETIKLALWMLLTDCSPTRIMIDLPLTCRKYFATLDDIRAIPDKRGGATNSDQNTDVIVLLEIGESVIVFGSQGDKLEDLVNLKRKAIHWNANILICATKADGSTVEEVESWAFNGDDVEWIEKTKDYKDNAGKASEIIRKIKDHL